MILGIPINLFTNLHFRLLLDWKRYHAKQIGVQLPPSCDPLLVICYSLSSSFSANLIAFLWGLVLGGSSQLVYKLVSNAHL